MKRTYPTDRLAKIGLFVNAGGPAPTPTAAPVAKPTRRKAPQRRAK